MICFYITDMNLSVDNRALVVIWRMNRLYRDAGLGGGPFGRTLPKVGPYPHSFELFLSPGDGGNDHDDKSDVI